jgi:hypothetical protein
MNAKLCECGCGRATSVAKKTHTKDGYIKGVASHFLRGHNSKGKNNSQWNGGRTVRKDGYVYIKTPGHPRARTNNNVLEHILIAEAAMGKLLPISAVVHHTDEKKGRIDPRGLVICPDDNYHRLLHMRSRALAACGNADWRKCKICKNYDDPKNLRIDGNPGGDCFHAACNIAVCKDRYWRTKEQKLNAAEIKEPA